MTCLTRDAHPALFRLGILDAARQAMYQYRQAINLRNDYPYPRFMLAKVYRSMGMEKKALTEEKLAIRIRVDNYIGCIVDPTPDISVPKGRHVLQGQGGRGPDTVGEAACFC